MKTNADPMLERLRPLPVRLRIAHLAALVRWERAKNARSLSYPTPQERERSLSYPSPCERERVVGREGRSEAEARVGGLLLYPHPAAHFIRDDPPRKGEGKGSARVCDNARKPERSSTANDGGRAG